MWIAPYNSQVDGLKAKLREIVHLWTALKRGKRVRTAASVFGFPKKGKLDPAKMVKKMNAVDKEVLRSQKLVLLIDEADLLSPGNRDAISEVLKILRNDSRPNGGAQVFEVGDPMQGEPYLRLDEREHVPGKQQLGARREITAESDAAKDPDLVVVMLDETPRFDSPLYSAGALEARLGHRGPRLMELLGKACARTVTANEQLSKISLFGTTKEVMDAAQSHRRHHATML